MAPKKETPAPDDSFKKVDVTISDVKTLILTLRSTEVDVCSKACDALEAFACLSDKNRLEVTHNGGIEALVKLLSSATPSLRQQSSLCLSTIMQTFEARQLLRKSGLPYLESITHLLGNDQSAVANENACVILDRLCIEYCTRFDILRVHLFPPIVTLLGSGSPEVKRAALRLVVKLLDEYDARASISQLGGLSLLVNILDVEFSELQQLALIALGKAAKYHENLTSIVDMNVLEKLVSFVSAKENKSSFGHALTTLNNLLNDPTAISRLASAAPVGKDKEAPPPPLATLIAFISNPDEIVQVNAMGCIGKAAATPSNRSVLSEFKAEAALVARLLSDDPKAPFSPTVICASCRAITVLSKSRPNSDAVGAVFGVQKLARLLTHDNESVVQSAVSTLAATLDQSPQNRKILLETDAVPRLVQLLSDIKIETKSGAAACLSAIAKSEFGRPAVRAAVAPLIASTSSEDALLCRESIRALAVLARDADVRAQLLAEGSIFRCLTGALSHTDSLVVRSAALLVIAISVDQQCVARLSDAGALQVLQSSALASQMNQNAFLAAAFQKLLDGNLSAKYAATGALEVTDIMEDGFYDTGCRSVPLPTLHQLCTAAIDTSCPIFLINSVHRAEVTATPSETPTTVDAGKHKHSKKEAKEKSLQAAPQLEVRQAIPTWSAPNDPALVAVVATVRTEILPIENVEARATRLAMLVSEKMGGAIALSQITNFDLELATLKTSQNSNVIPIGFVRQGSYRPRAILFKFLASIAEIPCALRRADYGHCFAVVTTPKLLVVDLVHSPGRLIPVTDTNGLGGPFWAAHSLK